MRQIGVNFGLNPSGLASRVAEGNGQRERREEVLLPRQKASSPAPQT